jgi:hypothetical protein
MEQLDNTPQVITPIHEDEIAGMGAGESEPKDDVGENGEQ